MYMSLKEGGLSCSPSDLREMELSYGIRNVPSALNIRNILNVS